MRRKGENMELNTIYNEDCLIGMQKIPDKSVNAIVTDPPYLYLKHKLDKPFDEDAVFDQWDRILKDDGFVVMFGRGESFYRWNTKLSDLGFNFKEEVIWDKALTTSPFLKLGRVHETISIFSKGNGSIRKRLIPYVEKRAFNVDAVKTDIRRLVVALDKHKDIFQEIINFLESGEMIYSPTKNKHMITGEKKKSAKRQVAIVESMKEGLGETDIISVSREHYSFKHPTQKPVRLMERLINLVTDEGDTILDPFLGSGSSAIACLNNNRNYIGFELDEEYFEIAQNRVNEHLESKLATN